MRTGHVGRPPIEEERHYVNTPVDLEFMPLLRRHRELTGQGMGPTVARIFTNHIEDLIREVQELEAAADDRDGQQRMDFEEERRTA